MGDSRVDMQNPGVPENDFSLPSPSSEITWKVLLQEKKKSNTSKAGTKRKLSLERPHKSRKMVQMNLFSGLE